MSKPANSTEVRLEFADADLSVLDGYCQATGKCRTDVFRQLLREWSERKLHEATLILRVANRNPVEPESRRS